MTALPYDLAPARDARLGLIVLQSDLTIEGDFRNLLGPQAGLLANRVPSGRQVTSDSLAEMQHHLTSAAALFPQDHAFDVVGYGCTSGSAEIGPERIAALIRQGTRATHVTEPVSALIAACAALGVKRLAMLSPYIEEVSARLRAVLSNAGIETPVFGSFEEPNEARVAAISDASIRKAAQQLAGRGGVDALFLSCTNLRTLPAIEPLERALNLPVLSSNLVLGWHMQKLAAADAARGAPGRLFAR